MRAQVIGGIQERADAFVEKCIESNGESMDVYVSSENPYKEPYLTKSALLTLFRTRLRNPSPLPPLRDQVNRRRGRNDAHERALVPQQPQTYSFAPFIPSSTCLTSPRKPCTILLAILHILPWKTHQSSPCPSRKPIRLGNLRNAISRRKHPSV